MDFELTAEQDALREMARDVFAKLYPPAQLRRLWDGDARDHDSWGVLADQGLLGLTIAESYGGMGGDAVDLLVVFEEAGRACVPGPLLETAAAATALRASALAAPWLPRLASGEVLVTVSVADAPFAVDADVADLLLYERDATLYAAQTFDAHAVAAEDRSRRLFRVAPRGGHQIGPAGPVRAFGAWASAAMLNGVSDRLLDMTLEHVAVRHQFGKAIGGFQAVKHKLASVHTQLQSAKAAARYAAYALATGAHDSEVAARVAKVQAVAAGALTNAEALQLHGGIGFTWEHDLHFLLKRGRALEHVFGSARTHRAALAAAVMDS